MSQPPFSVKARTLSRLPASDAERRRGGVEDHDLVLAAGDGREHVGGGVELQARVAQQLHAPGCLRP